MKNKRDKKNHGDRITGSYKPLEGSEFDKNITEVLKSKELVNIELLQTIREELKMIVASYLKYASRLCSSKIVLEPNDRKFFYDLLQDCVAGHVANFANCCIKYYCKETEITTKIDLSLPECGSLEIKKALQQASKNSKKIITLKINKIIRKIKKKEWNNVPDELYEEYICIEKSIALVCDFITTLEIGKLPKEISSDLYAKALKMYPNIENIYELNATLNIYKLTHKSEANYSTLPSKCAILFFRYNYIST